ncbi:hypothetical protein SERLA73DRAFT_190962 [Serpula lacrymans var. lacrymans S7.3]|uniref:Phosphatidic acid phosphatase type 2/haloperoxidase domain-containing protein n=1 Tax=Serpula lacrymans var. lacrymans (strain S7.3) TaxID=936435 RepID=F8QGQ4_SERL3|nr:hypothetical protein SERLA73DRAFT_190962 [Serpula lacrymans var. lacrymans S7.3]
MLYQRLLFVLAFGVYLSSVLKDFICSPRPFAPPVTRLTIGTHHLEYGFPSTHSTNSVSIALFIFSHIYHYYVSSSMSSITFYTSCALLFVYTFSIVFGRLYTAMHSFTDCAVGVLLGIFIWTVHWAAGEWMERWLKEGGWIVPLTIIPFCLLLVNQHPQPVDDCPCFEDAIAFISVIMGAALAQWHRTHYGMDEAFFSTVMAGSDGKTWEEVFTWWSIAGAKIVVGVLIIFVWRLVAKSALHFILPPLFRALALCFTLPSRRFYTPATDYEHVPMETGLHPIPSVIDLPGQMEMSGLGEPFGRRLNSLKQRRPGRGQDRSVSMSDNGFGDEDEVEKNGGTVDGKEVKHYDADVLTKVVVYAGIALLATEGVPVMFEVIGWGVRPW